MPLGVRETFRLYSWNKNIKSRLISPHQGERGLKVTSHNGGEMYTVLAGGK